MSAHDDFCGCGGYSCGQCFAGDPDATDNAWIDLATAEKYPGSMAAKMAQRRLDKYSVSRSPLTTAKT